MALIAPMPDSEPDSEGPDEDEFVKGWWPKGGLGANDGERG